MAVVDMSRVLAEHPDARVAEAQISRMRSEAKAEVSRLGRTDATAAEQLRRSKEREIQAESLRLQTAIVAEIDAVISRLAAKEGCQVVIDKSSPDQHGIPPALVSKISPDLTDEAIAELLSPRPLPVQPSPVVQRFASPTQRTPEAGEVPSEDLASPGPPPPKPPGPVPADLPPEGRAAAPASQTATGQSAGCRTSSTHTRSC